MEIKKVFILTAIGAVMVLSASVQASLIAYYNFDNAANGGLAAVGTDAALGVNSSISTTMTAAGLGSLALTAGTPDTAGNDGAVSGNSFTWATDTRSLNFWMKADPSQDANPTMISLGSGTGAGNRFDIRMTGGDLRLEVQGGGVTTSANVGDGNWYNITIALGDPATVATSQYFVYNTSANLVASGSFTGSSTAIATGDGLLRMGDSYQDTTRDFYGYLDEVRLYDNQLTQSDALGLAQMWSPAPVPEPTSVTLVGVGLFGLMAFRRWKKA
jgi:hypothetical protein